MYQIVADDFHIRDDLVDQRLNVTWKNIEWPMIGFMQLVKNIANDCFLSVLN